MKTWLSLSCPICGFRHPLKKFNPQMRPILYPVQVVTGGGRAKGFRVEKYLPWTTLPTLKQWFAITCPVCGFRFPLQKFGPALKPILYPVQVVTGGGRAKGFRVEKYLPWTTLPTLKQTDAWNSLLFLYGRLADAYDHFYQELGFLSPGMQRVLQELQKPYSSTYQTGPFADYSRAYTSTKSSIDVAEAYQESSYADAYTHGAILVLER